MVRVVQGDKVFTVGTGSAKPPGTTNRLLVSFSDAANPAPRLRRHLHPVMLNPGVLVLMVYREVLFRLFICHVWVHLRFLAHRVHQVGAKLQLKSFVCEGGHIFADLGEDEKLNRSLLISRLLFFLSLQRVVVTGGAWAPQHGRVCSNGLMAVPAFAGQEEVGAKIHPNSVFNENFCLIF